MKTFTLERDIDVSGISGTGTVAEGIQFSTGKVVIHWISNDHHSTVVWDSIDSVIAIHGHGGATRLIWTG